MKIRLLEKIDGLPVQISISIPTSCYLKDRYFQGRSKNLAGNFSQWENYADVFGDSTVIEKLLADVRDTLIVCDQSLSVSVCIDYGSVVGWSRTDDSDIYAPDDLVQIGLGIHAESMQVRPELTAFSAPRTKLITIHYTLTCDGTVLTILIDSVYPGYNIGELIGNVTRRKSLVFFDKNHPGEE